MVRTSLNATPNTYKIMASQSLAAALGCETDHLILLVKQLLADPGQSLVAGVAGVLLQLAGAHLVNTQVLVLLAHSSIAVVAVQRESLEEGSDENGPQNTYCVWGLGKSDLS